jgi:hypothetical protein
MKTLISSLLALVLMIGLSGCGDSKPSEDDVLKSAQTSVSAFKDMGYDVQSYVNIDAVEITDSYKQGNFYIMKVIPHIEVEKDITKQVLKTKLNNAYVKQVIAIFESIKKYQNGDVNKAQLQGLMRIGIPEGTLKDGDEFNGLESTYKFRKTDNGWRAVD